MSDTHAGGLKLSELLICPLSVLADHIPVLADSANAAVIDTLQYPIGLSLLAQ